MSIASLLSLPETSNNNNYYDPKSIPSLKRLDTVSSNNNPSPRGAIPLAEKTRASYNINIKPQSRKNECPSGLEFMSEYIPSIKLAPMSVETSFFGARVNDAENLPPGQVLQDDNEAVRIDTAHQTWTDKRRESNSRTANNQQRRRNTRSEVFARGFEVPNGLELSTEAKKYVEELHERIARLERDAVKLKKENVEVIRENKEMKMTIDSVIQEQERARKMKEEYEKKLRTLNNNEEDTQAITTSLKEILTMQAGEIYHRMIKKDEKKAQSLNLLKTSSTESAGLRTKGIRSFPSLKHVRGNLEEGPKDKQLKQHRPNASAVHHASKTSFSGLCSTPVGSLGNLSQSFMKTAYHSGRRLVSKA